MTHEPFRQAHPQHVPDPTLPSDDWRTDALVVATAIALLLVIFLFAVALAPGPW